MQEAHIRDSCIPSVPVVRAGRLRAFFGRRYWLRDMVLSSLLAVTVLLLFYQPVQVEGNSMLPLLKNHERIIVNKFAYHVESIRRGDIIVFHYPLDPAESFIKRVVGLPGDWVSIRDGQVFVNGKRVSEPYILPAYMDYETCRSVHVAQNHYYVLGDHRDVSNDSRKWGGVARKFIYGKAVFAYWPLSDAGLLH
ncbi:MAG: signal peptidase I [Acidobacteria bacterium]|nr:MAG: signal peptidase I [Acidobacteriota bacterium]